jgi:hypothetical protein
LHTYLDIFAILDQVTKTEGVSYSQVNTWLITIFGIFVTVIVALFVYMNSRFTEAKSERTSGFIEAKNERTSGFLEAKSERTSGFIEAKNERTSGFLEAKSERTSGFIEAKNERTSGFLEAKSERTSLVKTLNEHSISLAKMEMLLKLSITLKGYTLDQVDEMVEAELAKNQEKLEN